MKVLVIGSGGREHTITWMLANSAKVSRIFVANGNGGTATEKKSENIAIKPDEIDKLLKFAVDNKIDFTVVGPEIPLSMGIVDLFEKSGQKIFGPCQAAAKLESSKAFAKEIMNAAKVPTAGYKKFTDADTAKKWIKEKGAPIVVKADGLAAGKGVTVAFSIEEAISAVDDILVKNIFGESGDSIVVEEFLTGEEVSCLLLTDGKTVVPLASAQDHKAVFDGDKGPNTGGMGAYSPAPVLTDDQYAKLADSVGYPIINELKKRGIKFKGILYAGLMVGDKGINVLEYNCRFGDPETQAILPRLETDIVDLFMAVIDENLDKIDLKWSDKSSVSVVMTSGGYPGDYKSGYDIKGIDAANKIEGVKVFHSGTKADKADIKTAGGRVLSVTAIGDSLKDAIDNAYQGVKMITFDKCHYRKDIGSKALKKIK